MLFKGSVIKFYWRYLGRRVIVLLIVALLVGILDGFGLAMFLPLLQSFGSGEEASPEALNNLAFLLEGFTSFGLPLTMVNVLIIMMVFFILKGLIHFQGWKLHIWYKRQFIVRMRSKLITGLGSLPYLSFTKINFGRIQNTLTLEVDRVSQSFGHFVNMVNYFIMMSVYVAMAFSVNALFASYVTAGGILTNFFYRFVYKLTKRQSQDFSDHSNVYNSFLIQFMNNYKYLKTTGYLKRYIKKVSHKVDNLELSRFNIGKLGALLTVVREPMMVVIIGIVLIVFSRFHNADISTVMVSLLFFYRALTSLTSTQQYYNNFIAVHGSISNVQDMEQSLAISDNPISSLTGGEEVNFKKSIQLKNISLDIDGRLILNNIDLTIDKNQSVAFIGPSGSGKSTLCNIISGLIQPTTGTVLVDGTPLSQYNIDSWKHKIGYISQEPVIFEDTIFNNVTLWDVPTEKNKVKFWKSLERAAFKQQVERLAKKEEEVIYLTGSNFSGGEKQRIAIARELYKDVELLILDEATSALDHETEKSIKESIDQLQGSLTIISIAHRMTTIEGCDIIVNIEAGVACINL